MRPHTLGVDDGAFDKFRDARAVVVGIAMEGHDLVESVAVNAFPVDGDDATGFLAAWLETLRVRPALHAVFLGGITLAGLGVVDLPALAGRLGLPVIAVTRRDPRDHRLARALGAAGRPERLALVERAPEAFRAAPGVYLAQAGTSDDRAAALLRAARGKSAFPEPLRLAHLVARAIATGESRGRP